MSRKILGALLVVIALTVTRVSADTIVATWVSVAASGSDWAHTYKLELTPLRTLTEGQDDPTDTTVPINQVPSRFTIFDIEGFVSASFTPAAGPPAFPATFVLSTSVTGPSYGPIDFLVQDDPFFTNVTGTYDHPLDLDFTNGSPNFLLGHLVIVSNFRRLIESDATSLDVGISRPTSYYNTVVPSDAPGAEDPVPLPASAWTASALLAVLALMNRRRAAVAA
jgi:hypothetical protein